MYTVIIADDEEEIRRSLIRKIDWENIGFKVIGEAANGEDALELVEKLEPDLLLTDVKMPFISGIELARQVREIRPTIQIAFLSGYDDFSYAQQAIQYNIVSYMLKPISSEEITNELKNIKLKIERKFEEFSTKAPNSEKMEKSEFLMPLLLDSFQKERSEEEKRSLLEKAVECGVLEPGNLDVLKYVVIVTRILDENGEVCTDRTSVNAVDIILKKYVKHSSVYIQGKVVSLLSATKMGLNKYLHIIVEDISQSVQRIMGLNCRIGVSRIGEDLSCIHECYLEAMNAISYSKKNRRNIHFIGDEERIDTLDQESVQQTIQDIENLIRSGSQEEIREYFISFGKIIEQKKIAQIAINFIFVQLIASVFQVVYAVAGNDAVQTIQKNFAFYNMPVLAGNIEAALKYYEEICLMARNIVSEQRKKSSEVLCENTIRIINEKYMDPNLSLSDVSSENSVSPNYLSAVIKRENGSTFKDLLTKRRIEKAEELLLCTSMKIREIAEKCGYNDQHYFSYCFKKYTGMSPNACRRNHEENKE
ncbi:response regulator transcription factor [Faecalimonas sp.]